MKKPQIIKLKSLLREAPDEPDEPNDRPREKDDFDPAASKKAAYDAFKKSEPPKDPNTPDGDESEAAEQAHHLGLTSKGWGRWADKTGRIVAKTVQGRLVKIEPTDRDKLRDPAQDAETERIRSRQPSQGVNPSAADPYPTDSIPSSMRFAGQQSGDDKEPEDDAATKAHRDYFDSPGLYGRPGERERKVFNPRTGEVIPDDKNAESSKLAHLANSTYGHTLDKLSKLMDTHGGALATLSKLPKSETTTHALADLAFGMACPMRKRNTGRSLGPGVDAVVEKSAEMDWDGTNYRSPETSARAYDIMKKAQNGATDKDLKDDILGWQASLDTPKSSQLSPMANDASARRKMETKKLGDIVDKKGGATAVLPKLPKTEATREAMVDLARDTAQDYLKYSVSEKGISNPVIENLAERMSGDSVQLKDVNPEHAQDIRYGAEDNDENYLDMDEMEWSAETSALGYDIMKKAMSGQHDEGLQEMLGRWQLLATDDWQNSWQRKKDSLESNREYRKHRGTYSL